MKQQILQSISKCTIAYAIMLILFTSLIIGVQFVPQAKTNHHIYTAIKQIEQEGIDKQVGIQLPFFKLDNFTDCYMMNIIASADTLHPIETAIMNYFHLDERQLEKRNIAYQTEDVIKERNPNLPKQSYARYWHGYQVTLRPMLFFMDYSAIRLTNYILFTLLTIGCTWLIKKKLNTSIAVFFILTLLLVGFPIIPLSLQFSTCFYITLCSIFALLKYPWLSKKTEYLLTTFFVIGGITSYMDFLTTPQITLGLPMAIHLLASNKHKKCQLVIFISIAWFAGYASIWASKWMMAYLLTQHNVMAEVTEAAVCRSSDYVFGKHMTIANILTTIAHVVIKHHLLGKLWIVGMFFIGIIFVYIKMIPNKKVFLNNLYLLLIVAIIPTWYLALRNHSLLHYWFTWRACWVVLFCLLSFVYNTCSWKQLQISFKRLLNKRKHDI